MKFSNTRKLVAFVVVIFLSLSLLGNISSKKRNSLKNGRKKTTTMKNNAKDLEWFNSIHFCDKRGGIQVLLEYSKEEWFGSIRKYKDCKEIQVTPYNECAYDGDKYESRKIDEGALQSIYDFKEENKIPIFTIDRMLKESKCQGKRKIIDDLYKKDGINPNKKGTYFQLGINLHPKKKADTDGLNEIIMDYYPKENSFHQAYVFYYNTFRISYSYFIDLLKNNEEYKEAAIEFEEDNKLVLSSMNNFTKGYSYKGEENSQFIVFCFKGKGDESLYSFILSKEGRGQKDPKTKVKPAVISFTYMGKSKEKCFSPSDFDFYSMGFTYNGHTFDESKEITLEDVFNYTKEYARNPKNKGFNFNELDDDEFSNMTAAHLSKFIYDKLGVKYNESKFKKNKRRRE